jgi:F-type H+-transporting ATPase subunit a
VRQRRGALDLLTAILNLFPGILEIFGELIKLVSFSFRLFGNIFAGEVLLIVMAFLMPYVASLPFMGLELFVGFIQAFIFAILTLSFSMAAVAHLEEH